MRFVRFDIHHVRLPLNRKPWATSTGRLHATDTLLLRAETDTGAATWVESCALGSPTYLPDTVATSAVILRQHLAPATIGLDLPDARYLAATLDRFRGNPFARAAVDFAWHVLDAEARGLPLHRALGGRTCPVRCGIAVDRQPDLPTLLEQVAAAVAAGAPRVKLKIAPANDLHPLRAVRDAFPELPIMVDANAAYTLADLPLFRELDTLGLLMIEQPLHWRDLAEHATLQAALRTPICLDESITCVADVDAAIRLRACRLVNLKPARVGGFGPTLAILERCRAAGFGCWIGGMLESGLGTALALAAATLPGADAHPADLHGGGHFHATDLIAPSLRESSPCHLTPSEAPGLGVTVDLAAVEQLTVERWTVT